MILTDKDLKSQAAIDKCAVINKGLDFYDPDKQRADIAFFTDPRRQRMTIAEGDYLLNKIEKQIQERDQEIINL